MPNDGPARARYMRVLVDGEGTERRLLNTVRSRYATVS